MENIDINRRKYPRYDTEMEVYFKVRYDINIRVEFHVIESHHDSNVPSKYFGLCNNVSVEGLLVVSKKHLIRDDLLMLEVYDPIMKNPVKMEGQVRWSEKCPGPSKEYDMFYTGIQVVTVNDRTVIDSIYFDRRHQIVWSAILESLFGNFETLKKYPILRGAKQE
ncbi:MAG: PilZ domain-containing protein [Candidatus Omnitrophica bacterium]|nr:PilZ domain-containing protein [Candidatus Omnitrophota bacterium]